jgi:hypothetical protein
VDVESTGHEVYPAVHIVLDSSVVLEAEVEQCREIAEPDCNMGLAIDFAPAAHIPSVEAHNSAIDLEVGGVLASGLVARQHSMVEAAKEASVLVADAVAAEESGCT